MTTFLNWKIKLFFISLAALLSFFLSLINGSIEISGAQILNNSLDEMQWQVLKNIRLPRTITAILIGMNLSLSGAILQTVMKNPLADPHIIGISSGAGLFGIFVIIFFGNASIFLIPSAFVGGMLAAAVIYLLAWQNGIRAIRVILAGVAVSAFLGAGISTLLIFYSDRAHNALLWMVGSLSARSWLHVKILLPYSLIGTILAFLSAQYLNVLQLGDEIAKELGVHVNLARTFFIALAALLAASSVCVVGLLGFVGLVVPHMSRLILGSDHRISLFGAAFLGITTVTLSDTIARTIFSPVELPVGILMAALGAPFFLYLLRKEL